MKATKIFAEFCVGSESFAVAALRSAMVPFGSLTTKAEEIARCMVAWVTAEREAQATIAGEIVRCLWQADLVDPTTVEFDPSEVTLVTPTSSTRIACSKRSYVGVIVSIDFGVKGSEERMLQILAAALQAEVEFKVVDANKKEMYSSDTVPLLQKRADSQLAWAENLPAGQYQLEIQEQIIRKAREEAKFFQDFWNKR